MTPFAYSASVGSVHIITAADNDLGPTLVISPEDLSTLLQVTLVAVEQNGDPERMAAARAVCAEFGARSADP